MNEVKIVEIIKKIGLDTSLTLYVRQSNTVWDQANQSKLELDVLERIYSNTMDSISILSKAELAGYQHIEAKLENLKGELDI